MSAEGGCQWGGECHTVITPALSMPAFSSSPSILKNSNFGKSRVGKHWEWAGGEC